MKSLTPLWSLAWVNDTYQLLQGHGFAEEEKTEKNIHEAIALFDDI